MSAMGQFYLTFENAFRTPTQFVQFDDPADEDAQFDAAGLLLLDYDTDEERFAAAAKAAAKIDYPVFDGITCMTQREAIARRCVERCWAETFDPATAHPKTIATMAR